MYKRYLIILLASIVFFGCENESAVDVSNIEVKSKLVRFDSIFYKSDNLLEVKREYPMMFPSNVSDSIWFSKQKDLEDLRILSKSDSVFGDFQNEYLELLQLFKHFKYYLPKFESPDVYTIISDYDYEYPVLYSSDRLFVSLDMYLGKDFEDYNSFPNYIKNNFEKDRIAIDAGEAILRTIVGKDVQDKTLLSEMIYNGKLMYVNSLLNPDKLESKIAAYSEEQQMWCEKNEREIWSYLVSNEFLYKSDPQLKKRFIDVAPFTKFFLAIDSESPGRVGSWLGFQIVKSYMKNNEVSLEELIKNRDAKSIFVNSKYKPRK